VVEGEHGWRSEYAEALALLTDEPDRFGDVIARYHLAVEPDPGKEIVATAESTPLVGPDVDWITVDDTSTEPADG